MSHEATSKDHTVSTRVVEIAVAGAFVALSILIMYDNWRIGARWASDGPQAGYFPFYIGVIMFVASFSTLVVNLVGKKANRSNFVERGQLVQVLQVLIPTIVFVVLIAFLGIYLAAAIFITFFMMWLGKYSLLRIAPVAIVVPLLSLIHI